MIKAIASLYQPNFVRAVVYMLQATEYQIGPYLSWFWRTHDFSRVMHRRTIVFTAKAKLLLLAVGLGLLAQEAAAIYWLVWSLMQPEYLQAALAVGLFLMAPIVWAHLVIVPLLVGDWLITKPYTSWQVKKAARIFAAHRAVKIAVAGSYGKTTMKEILYTVLSSGSKKVAATPANKNVAISHAQFAKQLEGDEDILIVEFGEGAPGDVPAFCQTVKPSIGIICGLAPAHLDRYKTLETAGKDIFSLADYLDDRNVYVNGESEAVKGFIKPSHQLYGKQQAAGWKIANVKISTNGVSFEMTRAGQRTKLKSKLLGEHQIGPLALAATLADKLGLSAAEIEEGVGRIQPFEHRMQPTKVSGALIIDDTYNGNIDGMFAGLELLKALPAKRKIYVTPGLVDQGSQSAAVHRNLGEAITKASPDITVLMKHSVTDDIAHGIKSGDYKGKLIIEDDPLNFYNNLDQFVAAGDLVLMQNDWPDQYS